MSDMVEKNRNAGKEVAAMWLGFVEGGVPEEHATRILIGMLRNASKANESSTDLGKLLQMAQDH